MCIALSQIQETEDARHNFSQVADAIFLQVARDCYSQVADAFFFQVVEDCSSQVAGAFFFQVVEDCCSRVAGAFFFQVVEDFFSQEDEEKESCSQANDLAQVCQEIEEFSDILLLHI